MATQMVNNAAKLVLVDKTFSVCPKPQPMPSSKRRSPRTTPPAVLFAEAQAPRGISSCVAAG